MSSVLIRNARLVNEGRESDGDLLVSHGRIVKIAASSLSDFLASFEDNPGTAQPMVTA